MRDTKLWTWRVHFQQILHFIKLCHDSVINVNKLYLRWARCWHFLWCCLYHFRNTFLCFWL
jgi:hypothetical protein